MFGIPDILKKYQPKSLPKKQMQQRPLFKMENGLKHITYH